MKKVIIKAGDALDLLQESKTKFDLIATDPPYAFSGSGKEHALSATVAIVLRESAKRLKRGCWMVIFCASSWRSIAYTVESVRGIIEPVRVATWCKPTSRTKTRTPGWAWTTVKVIAFRKGKSDVYIPGESPDHIVIPPLTKGRRSELPAEVAAWAVSPFTVDGGTMLDPFAGSGALCKAASKDGMRSIGFELEV